MASNNESGENEKEYIVFCDESEKKGRYYSNFYGGLIVGASQYQRITDALNATKATLHFHNEVKWARVTDNYLTKYKVLMQRFFDEVRARHVRVRIMFRQNAHEARGLTPDDLELEYFKLYYQFIKHSFGLEHVTARAEKTRLRLYFDQFPDTKEKASQFKAFLFALQSSERFREARILIEKEDITEVSSHDHVLLQCLDIVLGAMCFRLNDKHLDKLPGRTRRGKRTIAKEDLYKHILAEIRTVRPNFNIGISTGGNTGENRWLLPYTHWNFQTRLSEFNSQLSKRGGRKS